MDLPSPTSPDSSIDTHATWRHSPRPWGRADLLAIGVWTAVVVLFFWDVVSLRRALFYFDITEINYPYRDFCARELKAGRLSFWIPGLYCGHPLYSESQAGYFHPFKYLFYPWLATWQAFNLDCVLSVWLTGAAGFGWLRRHVGPAGALAGAAILALSGYTWAHFVHTSMLNALASVPLAFWALEVAWQGRSLRALALGALALSCQVFAGHLQDVILTGGALGVYGAYRAATERTRRQRVRAIASVLIVGALCVLQSAVQWIPSKELIERSPRAGGLSWDDMTFGSWHPELLPTFLVREAYGTRARDTDWPDGYYPYHEMNVYLGVVGLALAVVGARGYRDRWVGFWLILGASGFLLMLGRYTFLMDLMPGIPLVGSGRVPVRYHLWLVVATAALAAVGVDRIARAELGAVSLRGALITLTALAVASVPILIYVYAPAWTERQRWPLPYHASQFAWLGTQLAWAGLRAGVLVVATWLTARYACASPDPKRRAAIAAMLPLLVIADLLAAHWNDVPTIEPSYWTTPPESARWLHERSDVKRIYGESWKSSGEPGYVAKNVDFMAVREMLAWSLPPVWGLNSTGGETPIKSSRRLRFTEAAAAPWRFDVEGLNYVIASGTTAEERLGPGSRVGVVSLHPNPRALERARLAEKVRIVGSEDEAARALVPLREALATTIVVEEPGGAGRLDVENPGTATIVYEEPDRVEVEVEARQATYLFLADTYDPGWVATVDGRAVPIRPADVAFRAVQVERGWHRIVFRYSPAGFQWGLGWTAAGAVISLVLIVWPRRGPALEPEHGLTNWRRGWPRLLAVVMIAVVLASLISIRSNGSVGIQKRWDVVAHRFTWGAGLAAMRPSRIVGP